MVLDEARLADLPMLRRSKKRQALLDRILASFRVTFRELEFELDAENTTINAHALTFRGSRYVRLYGGLAFHPLVGRQLLIFILLHETGHHLARGCRLPWDPRLACECVSDHWAVTEGAAALRASDGTKLLLRSVVRQMDLLFKRCALHLNIPASFGRQGCWAFDWSSRKPSIAAKRPVHETLCPLSKKVLPNFADNKRDLPEGGENGRIYWKS